MTNAEIGYRIHGRREELNLSLQEVAEKVGVAKSTVQRYESGKIGKIKLPIIEGIAKVLDVNPAWILGKTENTDDLSIDLQISRYLSALRERKELGVLMDIAISSSPAEVDKLINLFKALSAYIAV